MTNLMEQKYDERFISVRDELSGTKFAAFTTDLWDTKNHKKSFLRFNFKFRPSSKIDLD